MQTTRSKFREECCSVLNSARHHVFARFPLAGLLLPLRIGFSPSAPRIFWACTNLSPASFAPLDLPKCNVVLANPRNFIHVKLRRSGGFAKIVRGFDRANDA